MGEWRTSCLAAGAILEWVASTLAISSCTRVRKASWSIVPLLPKPEGVVELAPISSLQYSDIQLSALDLSANYIIENDNVKIHFMQRKRQRKEKMFMIVTNESFF